jgi:hypothetical protein
MSSYTLNLKVTEINAAAELAFKDTAFLFSRELTRVISQPRTWEGFAGARDIVDTGQLRASQQLVFTKPLEATYSWPVEHANYVHDGYQLRNGREVTGRPWTTVAQQEFDVQATYSDRYRDYLGRI